MDRTRPLSRKTLLKQRKPPRRGRRAPPTPEEEMHLARVAAMPCLASGTPEVVVHHIMHMPGKRTRRDHRFVVPLSPAMHNMGDQSVHLLGGEARFNEVHGVDLVAAAIRLWDESCRLFREAAHV